MEGEQYILVPNLSDDLPGRDHGQHRGKHKREEIDARLRGRMMLGRLVEDGDVLSDEHHRKSERVEGIRRRMTLT